MTITDTSTVSLLNASAIEPLLDTTYTATTDGFVFGVVNGVVVEAGSSSAYCSIKGTCGIANAVAVGGPFNFAAPGGSTMPAPVGNSFLLPVPANNPFTLSIYQHPGNTRDPVVSFVWIPMGTGTISGS